MRGLLAGAVTGAAAMYLLDPTAGRARRAHLRDKLIRAGHRVETEIEVAEQDVGNRARGLLSELRARWRERDVDDDVLVERVRARLGRCVSHPAAIEVAAHDGEVTLRGPVLAGETPFLLASLRMVRGVRRLQDQLERHEAADIEALQGGRPVHIIHRRWSPTAKLAIGLGVGALLLRI